MKNDQEFQAYSEKERRSHGPRDQAGPVQNFRLVGLGDAEAKARPSRQSLASATQRASVQRRYARKDGHVYTHAGGVGHLRDDYYHVWGGTFSVGYYLTESLALESSVLAVRSIPSSAARRIRRATGYVPDSEPQDVWLLTGARYSFGYAKALLFETALAHFDPQLFAQLGAARGQSRWMPTMSIGAGALAHLPFNIQVRLDLGMTVQLEKRTRGWVGSVGFLPQLTVGWAFDVASLWQEEAAG